MPTLIEIQIVKGKVSPYEMKMIYSDHSWSYFSRGFKTFSAAKKCIEKGFLGFYPHAVDSFSFLKLDDKKEPRYFVR